MTSQEWAEYHRLAGINEPQTKEEAYQKINTLARDLEYASKELMCNRERSLRASRLHDMVLAALADLMEIKSYL